MNTYISLEGNHFELAISSLVVDLGLPVVGAVKGLVAGGGTGSSCLSVGLGQSKSGTSSNGVDVRRDGSGLDNRITTLDGQRLAVDGELAEGIGTLEEAKSHHGQGADLLRKKHFELFFRRTW